MELQTRDGQPVELEDDAVEATIALGGRDLELNLQRVDAALATQVLHRLAELDAIARAALTESEDAVELAAFHLDELAPEAWIDAWGAVPLSAAAVLAGLRLVAVWGDPEDGFNFDYSVDPELSEYVLSVTLDLDWQVVAVAVEA